MMNRWISTADKWPPNDLVVETKVDDAKGCRNTQLLRRHGSLWFMADEVMYVYYDPTHWRYVESAESKLLAMSNTP